MATTPWSILWKYFQRSHPLGHVFAIEEGAMVERDATSSLDANRERLLRVYVRAVSVRIYQGCGGRLTFSTLHVRAAWVSPVDV